MLMDLNLALLILVHHRGVLRADQLLGMQIEQQVIVSRRTLVLEYVAA